jgi:5,10-methylenetetrahydromethanopterin reductase
MVQVYDDLLFKPAWPILFAMARELRGTGISVGPGVVNPYHIHPALIATNLASLNEEMNGDSFLMIGKGAFHDLFDVEASKPITAAKESIEIIHSLLAGTPSDYKGKMFKMKREAKLRWEYTTGKIPEIWIGTWGPRMSELAGKMRQVSGIMISSITDPSYIRYLRERVRAGALSIGRQPEEVEIGCVPGAIISEDRDVALDLARKASAVYLPYLDPMTAFVGIKRSEVESVKEALSRNDMTAAASRVSDKTVDSFKLWGTPDDIVEKVLRMLDSGRGAERINFGFGRGREDIEGIELLGQKVLPHLREVTKSR